MVTKNTLQVAVVQTNLHWENVEANLAMFDGLLANAGPADLIVLPEMFATGFSMQPEKFAQKSYTLGFEWLKQKAKQTGAAITGSLMAPNGNTYVNRLLFVLPDGQYYHYDKKHLFGLGSETEHYSAGTELLLVDYLGWKICPLICYDLRFPVWSRNTHNYDVLLYTANWPQRRAHHWRTLLPARAVENQSYVVACNRIGDDGNGIGHSGNSAIISFSGDLLAGGEEAAIYTATLSKEDLTTYRNAFPFLKDADKFEFVTR
jgi:omega-amidase